MTTSEERTKAVIDTRDFLKLLATAEAVTIPGLVQSVAVCLLRHYPTTVDLDISSSALPELWGPPIVERPKELSARSRVAPLLRTRTNE